LRDGSINLIPKYNGNLLGFYNQKYTERTTAEVDGALTEAIKADKLASSGRRPPRTRMPTS